MCHLLPLSSDIAFKTSVNVIDNPTLVISSESGRLFFFFKSLHESPSFYKPNGRGYVVTPNTGELGYAFPPWLLWSAPVFMSEWNQISHVWFKSAFPFFFHSVFSRQTGWRIGFHNYNVAFYQTGITKIYMKWIKLFICDSWFVFAAFHTLAVLLVGTCSADGPGSQWGWSRAEKGEGRGEGHNIPSWPVTSFQQGQEVRELGG